MINVPKSRSGNKSNESWYPCDGYFGIDTKQICYMMRLYLVQHAEAKSEEEDPARPLSEEGLGNLEKVISFLGGKGIKVSEIVHSGKLRAKQTAEKLGEAVSSPEIREVEGLSAKDDPGIWEKRLRTEEKDMMVVGHLPHLERLAGLLLSGEEREVVDFENAGVVCLEKEDEKWSVQWIVTPQIL